MTSLRVLSWRAWNKGVFTAKGEAVAKKKKGNQKSMDATGCYMLVTAALIIVAAVVFFAKMATS